MDHEAMDRLPLPASSVPQKDHTADKELVWIVFRGIGEMGRSLVECAVSENDLVASVGQVNGSLSKELPHGNDAHFEILCDVRARNSVARVVQSAVDRFGRIDIVACCSDYRVIGACEDQDEFEIRNQFEINFMGTLHIIQASLPHFRRQRFGRYIIFCSTSGALGMPGLGPYCATKHAVEGLVESLSFETEAFNIKPTIVEMGLIKRDETEVSMGPLHYRDKFPTKPASEAYVHATSPALHAKRMMQWLSNRQPTSVAKSAKLVWQLAHCAYPPLRLPLGSYAIESIRDRLRCVTEELEDWKHLHFCTAETGHPRKEGSRDIPADRSEGDTKTQKNGETLSKDGVC